MAQWVSNSVMHAVQPLEKKPAEITLRGLIISFKGL
jgi:hypothetical protein